MENLPDKTIRPWGYYRVLHTVGPNVKVKELTVEPGKALSMQKHQYRQEFWFVAEGVATIHSMKDEESYHLGDFGLFCDIHIESDQWHRLSNEQEFDLKIIEIQYGDACIEEDITRK